MRVPPRLLEVAALTLPDDITPVPAEAAVELLLEIDATGAVTRVEVITPLREDIDPLVVEAARALRFAPATRDGAPVAARVRFRFGVETQTDTGTATSTDTSAEPVTATATATGTNSGTTTDPETAADPDPPAPTPSFAARAVIVPPEPGAATRVTLTGEELTTVPGTFGEPLRVVATMPGVARTPFGLGYFLVRGASFENTGFFVDGFPVPLLYHLGAGPAVLSSRLVERLDFYPGGYPASYGRFNAGIVALTTAPPATERPTLELEVDVFRASLLGVLPFPERKGSVAIALRRSYYELILPLIVDGIELSFTDYQLRVDYNLTPRVRTSLFYFGSRDVLDTSDALGESEGGGSTVSVGYGFDRVIGKLELRLPDRVRVALSGSVGFDSNDARSRQPGTPDLSLGIDALFLGERLDVTWTPNDRFRTHAGIDLAAFIIQADATLPLFAGFGEYPKPDFAPEVFDIDARIQTLGLGLHAEQKLTFGPVELTGGLRADHFRYGAVSTVLLQPRGIVRLHASEDLLFKVATGLFSQTPQPFQLIPNLGETSLRPNRSWQSSAGVELELPERVEIESQLFYSRFYALPRPANVLTEEPDGTVRRQLYFDDGEGRAYGWELLVRRKVEEGLYGWLSYTLSRSERFVEGGETVPFNFDQTHVLNLAASYKTGPWRFGLRFQLATGRPGQAVVGAVYDADADRFRPIRTGLDIRLPTFHQLDARIDYEWQLGPFQASVYLDALNIYNSPNSEGFQYQYDFARSAPLPGIPTIATLGFKLVY